MTSPRMRKILDRIYHISGGLAAASIVFIALVVCGQVIFNLIDYFAKLIIGRGFGLLIPSYVSLSGYALALATFLSLGLGLRHAAHIRVTLLESRLPPVAKRSTLLIVTFVGVAMGALFTFSFGKLAFQSFTWGDQSVGLLKISLWIPQSIMCLGMGVFLIAAIDTFIEVWHQGDSTALKPETVTETEERF